MMKSRLSVLCATLIVPCALATTSSAQVDRFSPVYADELFDVLEAVTRYSRLENGGKVPRVPISKNLSWLASEAVQLGMPNDRAVRFRDGLRDLKSRIIVNPCIAASNFDALPKRVVVAKALDEKGRVLAWIDRNGHLTDFATPSAVEIPPQYAFESKAYEDPADVLIRDTFAAVQRIMEVEGLSKVPKVDTKKDAKMFRSPKLADTEVHYAETVLEPILKSPYRFETDPDAVGKDLASLPAGKTVVVMYEGKRKVKWITANGEIHTVAGYRCKPL